MSFILDETKYSLSEVRRSKGASITVQKRLLDFLSDIDKRLPDQSRQIIYKVNINGVTGFINSDKSFIMIDFYPDYISILFWTGALGIMGLGRGNWPDGTPRGSERVKISENPDANHQRRAVEFACKAFQVAMKECN